MTVVCRRAFNFHHPELDGGTAEPKPLSMEHQHHGQRGVFHVDASAKSQIIPNWCAETVTFKTAVKTGDVVVLSENNLVDGVEHPSHVWPHGREVR